MYKTYKYSSPNSVSNVELHSYVKDVFENSHSIYDNTEDAYSHLDRSTHIRNPEVVSGHSTGGWCYIYHNTLHLYRLCL